MAATSEFLKQLGLGTGILAGGAATHGLGLGKILEPLDYPRQALYNLAASPLKAMETGDPSHLLGAIPGIAGAALGGLVGGPVGILAGSLLGGAAQGVGQMSGREAFNAPAVSDLTGTEDFLPNLAVGMATDPLSYAGLGSTWRAGSTAANGLRKAINPLGDLAAPAAKAAAPVAEAAIPVAKFAPPEAKRIAPMFYSRLEEGIQKLPESLKSESVINQLKKMGVTNEELEATNFAAALDGKPRVSKQDLLKHFGENKIQVSEVMAGGEAPAVKEPAWIYRENLQHPEHHPFRHEAVHPDTGEVAGTGQSVEQARTGAHGWFFDVESGNASQAKYAGYQTPGGSNYRELRLTLPEKPLPEGYSVKNLDPSEGYKIIGPDGKEAFGGNMHFSTEQEAITTFNHRQGNSFKGSHWDEPNVIAHARFNDRIGPNGGKILHIEEIQSDLHQIGKKEGYLKPGEAAAAEAKAAKATERLRELNGEIEQVNKELDKEYKAWSDANRGKPIGQLSAYDDGLEVLDRRLQELTKEQDLLSGSLGESYDKVPSLPFKENWHELTMKRLIRHAAENGYDAITLNPGEQINKVLGSGGEALGGQKQFYDKQLPKWMEKYGKQYGVKVEPHEIGGSGTANSARFKAMQSEYETLLADKAAASEARDYAKVDALRPRLDALQMEIQRGLGESLERPVAVSRMNITPQMREAVMTRGQPLMSVAPLLAGGAGGSALLAALMGQES